MCRNKNFNHGICMRKWSFSSKLYLPDFDSKGLSCTDKWVGILNQSLGKIKSNLRHKLWVYVYKKVLNDRCMEEDLS